MARFVLYRELVAIYGTGTQMWESNLRRLIKIEIEMWQHTNESLYLTNLSQVTTLNYSIIFIPAGSKVSTVTHTFWSSCIRLGGLSGFTTQ